MFLSFETYGLPCREINTMFTCTTLLKKRVERGQGPTVRQTRNRRGDRHLYRQRYRQGNRLGRDMETHKEKTRDKRVGKPGDKK